ncbi:MAG: DUF427 domain-containing protein [Bacteroidetes bacterium]|jgi:uncharacterized protein (DUF427 family)|nr:DUF427 domain-containing protein [Bacteroidota bacterium]
MKKRIKPKAGQESVWDYPRPPRLEPVSAHLTVKVNGEVIASTNKGYRVVETSHPPVYYIPQEDAKMEYLKLDPKFQSHCEFKGKARYWNLRIGDRNINGVAWSYPEPTAAFQPIKDYLAFYPSKVDECYVGDEKVQAQEGDFYGGWITSKIVGPFKGGPGTWGW